MKYLLKNKDECVLSFELSYIEGIYKTEIEIKNVEIYNEKALPYNFDRQKGAAETLSNWIQRRKIPKNREFANKILAVLGSDIPDDIAELIKRTLLLSLNDSFWIVPDDKNFLWRDFNLYTNPLNEKLALVAFTGQSIGTSDFSPSPEFTTNGMLKKCWRKNKASGKIELVKGQITDAAIKNYGREAFSEYYMAQIAEVFGFNHVKYDLEMLHDQIVSVCELFTSENVGFIPMGACIPKIKGVNERIDKIIGLYGKEAFEDLMLFDALICNSDRHLGNFGMLIENDTQKLIKPAPIFDNGYSFLNLVENGEFHRIKVNLKENGHFKSAFDMDFDKQAEIFARHRHIKPLEKLLNFKFKRHERYNLSNEVLSKAESLIQDRSDRLIEAIEMKQKIEPNQAVELDEPDEISSRMKL